MKKATLFEFNHTDSEEPTITAYLDDEPINTRYLTTVHSLFDFIQYFERWATIPVRVANTEKENIPNVPDMSPTGNVLRGKTILIDAGHSKSMPGAHGVGPASRRPEEYEHNLLQAKVLKEILEKNGAICQIYDPDPDNLIAVGKYAQGKDIALFLHHNAANADGNDEGTECYIHARAGQHALTIADSICANISKAIKCKNRGVKRASYTVLSESIKTSCPINILVESYFIDDYSDKRVTEERSRRAAIAIADAILAHYSI